MFINLTRRTGIWLAFGFFFIVACSIQVHTLDEAEELYRSGDYSDALRSINHLLREDPESEELLFLKASTLSNLAKQQAQPHQRSDYYHEMRLTADLLRNSEDPSIRGMTDSLMVNAWREEHGAGQRLLEQSNPGSFSGNFESVIAHFRNALIINADSSSTYTMKATAYYRNGDLQYAVEALQDAEDRFDPMPFEMSEKLAFLLLEEGQIEKSIAIYRQLLENEPNNEDIKHGLVNAYILDGQHERSIELLRDLIEADHNHLTYHEALATELFFHIQNSVASLSVTNINDAEIIEEFNRLMEDLEEAEELYQFVKENHSNPAEITFITAAFYKNTAGTLIDLAGSMDVETAEILHDKAIELLTRSVPVWQEVAERNPENTEIWRSMYQIYTQLDMIEEAEDARSKANL